ncbi:hypothetical protein F5Y09DRAFT_313201 [Xylaria sp. FL1042]|nr:hypothetical protein F5Y09DRAFT_313201 [Xylaria sp. FL1042]
MFQARGYYLILTLVLPAGSTSNASSLQSVDMLACSHTPTLPRSHASMLLSGTYPTPSCCPERASNAFLFLKLGFASCRACCFVSPRPDPQREEVGANKWTADSINVLIPHHTVYEPTRTAPGHRYTISHNYLLSRQRRQRLRRGDASGT